MSKINHISAREFHSSQSNFILVDVRPDYELATLFDVETLVYMSYTLPDKNFKNLPMDKNIIVADAVGLRSKEVCLRLLDLGYEKVFNLVGGIVEWERLGLPVSLDKNRILTGSCMCQLKPR